MSEVGFPDADADEDGQEEIPEMYIVEVNGATCDGETCRKCIDGCPVEMLALVAYVNGTGEEKQVSGVVTDMADCIGCMACETVCTTESIKVTEY